MKNIFIFKCDFFFIEFQGDKYHGAFSLRQSGLR